MFINLLFSYYSFTTKEIYYICRYLTLKAPQSKIVADGILIFYLYCSKKIKLDFSCESSAQQRIHLKHQVLFSLKSNEKHLQMLSVAVVIGALRVKLVHLC